MTQRKPPVLSSSKRQQLFQLLEMLESIRRSKSAPTATDSTQKILQELLHPLDSALANLAEGFALLWSATEKQVLKSTRRRLATSHPQRIVDDLHMAVMGLLDRTLHEEAQMPEYVEVLQVLVAVTRLLDIVLGEHLYRLDAEEFPWLCILYGKTPEDCPIELDTFVWDTRSWVLPEDTRGVVEHAIQQRYWRDARYHLRQELNFATRPAHAVRVLFLLWTIETALLNQARMSSRALLPN